MAEKKKQRTELDIDDVDFPVPSAPTPEPVAPAPEEKVALVEEEPTEPKEPFKITLVQILIGIIVVIVLGLIWLIFISEPPAPVVIVPEKTETPVTAKPAPVEEVIPDAVIKPVYLFEPFILPLKGSKGKEKYLKISFAAEMSGEEVKSEIERNLVLVRENIYLLLRGLSERDFNNEEKRKATLINVAIAVNLSIQSGAITRALVTEITIF